MPSSRLDLAWVAGLLLGGVVLSGAGMAGFAWWTARRVNRAVLPTGGFVEIDGQRIHYTDQGHGPAILFIHGLGGQTRNFPAAVIAPLARRSRVVVFDRPGSGHSMRPFAAGTGLHDQADIFAALITRLGLERPLIVGHSLGGALALTLALDYPGQVGGLALIAPLTQPQDTVPQPFRALAVRSRWRRLLIAWTLAVPASIRYGRLGLAEVFGPDPIPADHATTGGGLLGLRPSAYYGASADLMAVSNDLHGIAARYGDVAVPVGILFGSGDRILEPGQHGQAALAQIPGATLELVEGRGHMVPITAPEQTVAFIQRMQERATA